MLAPLALAVAVVLAAQGESRAGAGDPPALEGPVSGSDLLPDGPPPTPSRPAGVVRSNLLHEAFRDPKEGQELVRTPKGPPAPIAERPTGDRPSPDAVWVEGYWAWDPSQKDFTWVAGAWRVPPRDRIWVSGRWVRDEGGWTRVPGFWSQRRIARRVAQTVPAPDDPTASTPSSTPAPTPGVAPPVSSEARTAGGSAPAWKQTGPPTTAPADVPGQAPGPDAFYVSGHYVPRGNQVVWLPGYWAKARPGMDWVPARWVRRADGWDFRPGYWAPDTARTANDATAPPPTTVESQPREVQGSGTASAAGAGPNAAPLPGPGPRDPIAEAESATRPPTVVETPSSVTVAPGNTIVTTPGVVVRSYPMVRPPVVGVPPYPYGYGYGYDYGYGPRYYDPLGVIPPRIRGLIDRFVP